jgi:WD40 repeat protein
MDHPSIRHVEMSPDGRRVVTASAKGTARLWRFSNGSLLAELTGHRMNVEFATFSPDSARVVTASMDGTARLWDAETGDPLAVPLQHEARVWFAQFRPDGQALMTASDDRTVRVWDANTGEALTEPLRHESRLSAATFSADGTRIVTAMADGKVRVWDIRTGRAITEPLQHLVGKRVMEGKLDEFSRTLSEFYSLLDDWTNLEPREAVLALAGREFTGARLHVAPGHRWLVVAFSNGTQQVWNELTGRAVTPAFPHDRPVRNFALSDDGRRFATTSDDGVARVWDAANGRLLADRLAHYGAFLDPVFSPGGQRLLLASDRGTLRVWDAATGQPAGEPMPHRRTLTCARFSPDGQSVATGSHEMAAMVWDPATGQRRLPPLRHDSVVYCAQFSPDGALLATASEDRSARVWDARTGRPWTDPMRHAGRVRWVEFSPDGKRLATFCDDRTAQLWDVATGRPLGEPLRHYFEIWPGGFTKDGRGLVTFPLGFMSQTWNLTPPPLPAPGWLADLAEAVGGRRVNERGALESVPAESILTLRPRLSHEGSPAFYANWLRWFFADRVERSLAPDSSTPMPDYVRRMAKEDNLKVLQYSAPEAFRCAPTNGLVVARLARFKIALFRDGGKKTIRLVKEAEWLGQQAARLAPKEHEAWMAWTEALIHADKLDEALTVAEAAIKELPDLPILWQGKAIVLDRAGRLEEAVKTYAQAAEVASASTNVSPQDLSGILRERERLLKKLARGSQTQTNEAPARTNSAR